MRTPFVLFAVLVSAFLLGACGGPDAGDSCNTNGFVCGDDKTVLECTSGKWRSIPCRGAGGCSVNNNRVSCDVTRNQAGDACASANEGQGICHPNGSATLECRNGVFVQTNTCSSCTVSGERVVCTP